METRTILDKIEIEPQTGNIGLRMRKEIIGDDGKLMAMEYHRAMLAPRTDSVLLMAAVNIHLARLGYPPVKVDEAALINTVLSPLGALRASKAGREK